MSQRHHEQLRQRIAQEAARILAEEGGRDFLAAKQKARDRLGIAPRAGMPSNIEVEEALRLHQRLFGADRHARHLRRMREAAVQAMRLLAPFSPRLSGPVLTGTAASHSDITLHLLGALPEEVAIFLMDQGIPHETGERRLRMSSREEAEPFPVLRFLAEDLRFELVLFPERRSHQAPLSPVDGRPEARATLREVEALLAE